MNLASNHVMSPPTWRGVEVDGMIGAEPAVRPELSVDAGAVPRRDHPGLEGAVGVPHAVPVVEVTHLGKVGFRSSMSCVYPRHPTTPR